MADGYELLGGYAQAGENDANLRMPATAPCLMHVLDSPKRMCEYSEPEDRNPRPLLQPAEGPPKGVCSNLSSTGYVLPSPHTPLDPSADPVPPPLPLASDVLRCRNVAPLVVAVGTFSGCKQAVVTAGQTLEQPHLMLPAPCQTSPLGSD